MKRREALARARQALTNIIRGTGDRIAKDRLRAARRSLTWEGEDADMPAVPGYDNQDGTFGTRQPNPQSANVEAVLTDGSELLWRDDDINPAQNLTWNGTRGTYHLPKNGNAFIVACAKARNGVTHDVTISTTGFAGLVVRAYSVRYIQQTAVSFFGSVPGFYQENMVAQALRHAVSVVRSWLGRPKANQYAPVVMDDEDLTAQVPAEGSQIYIVELYAPKATAAGTIQGNIILTDETLAEVVLGVDAVVRDVELPDGNVKPNLIYAQGDIGDRAEGPAATQADRDDWLDEAYRVLRRYGLDPFTDDNIGGSGFATPVPGTRQLNRLSGSIFAADTMRGAAPLDYDVVGAYTINLFWEGMAGAADDEAKKTVTSDLLVDRNTALTTAGLTLETAYFTNDEGTAAEAQRQALWADEATTGVKPMATFATDSSNLIEYALPNHANSNGFGGQATAVKWVVGAGHVVPKDSLPIWQAARDAGYRVGWYNGILPANGSSMQEERPLNQALNYIIDTIDGHNIRFIWSATYHYSQEVFDMSGLVATTGAPWVPDNGPEAGLVSRFTVNPLRVDHTFGSRTPLGDDSIGINQNPNDRLSCGDGWVMAPKKDFYYNDDYHRDVIGFYPFLKLPSYRRGIEIEQLIALARAADLAATDALLAAWKPLTPFEVGAGDGDGDAPVFDSNGLLGNRTYINAASPNARVHQEDIDGDELVQLQRDLFAIVEGV